MRKVRFGWRVTGVDEDYKPTSKWALQQLEEHLKEHGVKEFEVVFQKDLKEDDCEMIDYFYLLKTDKEFIQARVFTFINELDVFCVVTTFWLMEASLAKRVAREILTKQTPLDEWVN